MLPPLATLRRAVLPLFVALSGGCNASSASSAPAQPAVPKPPAGTPRIVGTVVSSTRQPPGAPRGAVVYLEDAPKQPGVAMAAEIVVRNKDFTPFVAVVTTGGTVTFGNSDALTHHVFSPELGAWDTGYLQKDQTAARRFDVPGAVSLLCNIHPEMIGYVLVIPSTYYGRVGADGRYAVDDVPSGTYRATAWAPRMQPVSQTVTVGSAAPATLDFDLRREDSPSPQPAAPRP
jgi:plastocyanin